jgi:2-polyprenyl-3-methyl-5-hydroxy-6-metoxy-1,4-benzoquinol methylase
MKDRGASPAAVAARARHLFREADGLNGALQRWRPYVCPFGPLIEAVPPGAVVLDIGCGGGLFLGLLADAERLGRGVGVDTSDAGIATANRMRESNALQQTLEFHRTDASDRPPGGPYDVVTLIDVLHHLPPATQRKALVDACVMVRPGGRLIVKEIATRPRWRAVANRIHDLIIARQWVHHIAPDAIMDALAAADIAGSWVPTRRFDTLWYGHVVMVFDKTPT